MWAKHIFVFFVLMCLTGNTWGRSWLRRSIKETKHTKYKNHAGRDRPVYVKCKQFLNFRHQAHKENYGRRANQPFGPLCRPHMDKFMKCFQENIYNSRHPYDVIIRTNTNFYRVMNATTRLCEEYNTHKPDMSKCVRPASRCISGQRMYKGMTDSHRFCTRNKIRCDYQSFSHCDIKGAMMASRYFFESDSNGCIVTDPLFQLIPNYGPELDCYAFINMHGYGHMNLAQAYDHFCKEFHVHRVLSCIGEKFSNITSKHLLEDRAKYIARAKEFAHDRHKMCKALFSPENDDCMRDGESVDLSKCQRDMFLSAIDNDRATLDDAVEKYSNCIFHKYAKCNKVLAKIIRDNLKTWNE